MASEAIRLPTVAEIEAATELVSTPDTYTKSRPDERAFLSENGSRRTPHRG